MEMSPSTSVKGIHVLTSKMVRLSSFISRYTEKGFSFFKILQEDARFVMIEETRAVFDELKKFLANLLLLTKPIPREPLIRYIFVGPMVVSSVLLREENGQLKPIYYVSRLLHEAEQCYADLEKEAGALVNSARK